MMRPARLDAGMPLSSEAPWLCGARGGSTRPANENIALPSVLGRVLRAVSARRARARAHAAARQSLSCLTRLDDHALRDIGLNRVDLHRKLLTPPYYGV
jgi:uncharacterized protein YjiS (DUF1127 family)